MANTYVLELTEEERDRIATVIACNTDINLDLQMKDAMRMGNAARVAQLNATIEADRALMLKVLDAKTR